jgi:hypothetical protein
MAVGVDDFGDGKAVAFDFFENEIKIPRGINERSFA